RLARGSTNRWWRHSSGWRWRAHDDLKWRRRICRSRRRGGMCWWGWVGKGDRRRVLAGYVDHDRRPRRDGRCRRLADDWTWIWRHWIGPILWNVDLGSRLRRRGGQWRADVLGSNGWLDWN